MPKDGSSRIPKGGCSMRKSSRITHDEITENEFHLAEANLFKKDTIPKPSA
jgi:hypothetical protein